MTDQDDTNNQSDDFGDEDTDDTVGETNDESSADEEPKDKAEKRIRDLQSKADAAEARANKAEAALKAASAGKGSGTGSPDPATQVLVNELREASLDAIYADQPLLKQYGIDRAFIEGSTRAEMRESADSVVGLIKSVSTKVRNETLEQNGLTAESAGSSRRPPVDYGSMNEEDFKKLLDSIS